MDNEEKVKIGPQKGPQTEFLYTKANIAIYGGAAGGGKSYALLLEPLRHLRNSKFGAVIFRRNSTQVRNQGGLWSESMSLYSQFEGHSREAFLEWIFPIGMKVKFAHLENESTVYDWQGAQVPFIGFDELVHFTEKQFWYLLSRNRSTSGVAGYIRATCNPDADSWVRQLVDWWIDSDGYPIKERSGVLRWFVRREDEIIWKDDKKEFDKDELPKSFTFIPSKITDNKILMEKDPSYLANLKALSRIERLRLLGGNWNVRASAGMLFQREWFPVVDAIPGGWIQSIRFWDRACLIAGTQVKTKSGLKPIQSLTVNDKVLTRSGFCEVEWAGISKISDELTSVIFSNGKVVTGTKEHPIWTENRSWVNLSNLTAEDTVYTEIKNISITMVVMAIIARFTEMFTSFTKAPFPTAIISTTRTETDLIIESKILNALQEKNMPRTIKTICLLRLALKTLRIEKMHLQLFTKKHKNQKNIFVKVVKLFFMPKVLKQNIAAFAASGIKNIFAKYVKLSSIREDSIRSTVVSHVLTEGVPVYDVSVKKNHEFFANGILVHNSTKPNESNKDPDWTRGLKLLKYPDGRVLVADLKSIRDTPGKVEDLVRNVASHDSQSVRIVSQQDPGSAGVAEAENFIRMLVGYDVHVVIISKDKVTRSKPVSAQCEVGNIKILRAPWNNEFFTELENFPDGKHDDIVDVLSGAFNELCGGFSLMDVL